MTIDTALERFCDASIERALLGLILLEREIPESQRFLEPGDFGNRLNRAIYTAMCALQAEGHPLDVPLILSRIHKDPALGEFKDAHLVRYLNACLDLRPAPDARQTYARRIVDLSGKHKLLVQALLFVRDLLEGRWDDLPATDVRARHTAALERLKLAPPAPQCAAWADLQRLIEPIVWDWPGWLPRGFLTLLAGEAGLGKSILALRLCACYLRGDDWPDGASSNASPDDAPSHVLWCEAESAQVIHWERATSWGLPLDRILAPMGLLEDVSIDAPTHQSAIARAAHRPEVRLVVVNSFGAAIRRSKNTGRSLAAVRWLASLARDTGKPVLLLHHLRAREKLDDLGGIAQPARTVLALDAPDPNRGELKRLLVIKNSLVSRPDPIGVWVAERGEVRFGAPPEPPQRLPTLDRAVHAIRDRLQNGPLPAATIMRDLQQLGFSMRTIHRAKAQLGVYSDKERDGWVWALPLDKLELAARDR